MKGAPAAVATPRGPAQEVELLTEIEHNDKVVS